MKKIIAILIITLGNTIASIAQEHRKESVENTMSIDQKTELAVKKMTLKLDLTADQQQKITPLITKQIANRKEARDKMKEMKMNKQKPSSDERFKMMNTKLDNQIAFKTEMRRILNPQQYERFEKISERKMRRIKKRMHKKNKYDDVKS